MHPDETWPHGVLVAAHAEAERMARAQHQLGGAEGKAGAEQDDEELEHSAARRVDHDAPFSPSPGQGGREGQVLSLPIAVPAL